MLYFCWGKNTQRTLEMISIISYQQLKKMTLVKNS